MKNSPSTISELHTAAVDHHRAGRLQQAESIYRQILREDPENAGAHHLLGLLAHQSGDNASAVLSIEKAVTVDPQNALYHFNLGVVLGAEGDAERAVESYRHALDLNPNFGDAYNNLGLLLEKQGKMADAVECFEACTRLNPAHAEAYVNLGKILLNQAILDKAHACFRRALELKPTLAEAHFGIGRVLEDREAWEQAADSYREALALKPDFREAHNNLGTVLMAQGRYAEAQKVFLRHLEMTRGLGYARPQDLLPGKSAGQGKGPAIVRTTRFALLDRAEQIEYLIGKGALEPSFAEVAAGYRSLAAGLEKEGSLDKRVALSAEQVERIGGFYDRIIHYADGPACPSGAVNDALDFQAIEESFLADGAPVVCFDDFLSREALEGLRKFCLESTIYFGADPAGYVTSYLPDGFSCGLLYQIAAELKERFPRVVGPRFLSNMWAYRYDARAKGVDAHTDYAAVSFNFWITPDAANLYPGHGGLVVYKKEQPREWDWMELNRWKNDPDIRKRIGDFLSSAEAVTIPYGQNRAVLFASNLFHRSEDIHFADGFENRRINITMLFGQRSMAHG